MSTLRRVSTTVEFTVEYGPRLVALDLNHTPADTWFRVQRAEVTTFTDGDRVVALTGLRDNGDGTWGRAITGEHHIRDNEAPEDCQLPQIALDALEAAL